MKHQVARVTGPCQRLGTAGHALGKSTVINRQVNVGGPRDDVAIADGAQERPKNGKIRHVVAGQK